jgi:hypothetical protein
MGPANVPRTESSRRLTHGPSPLHSSPRRCFRRWSARIRRRQQRESHNDHLSPPVKKPHSLPAVPRFFIQLAHH